MTPVPTERLASSWFRRGRLMIRQFAPSGTFFSLPVAVIRTTLNPQPTVHPESRASTTKLRWPRMSGHKGLGFRVQGLGFRV